MIANISISNYKSIDNISIDLGRINVFIGENGAGKSNILEAIALVSAAAERKLDNEFLASRGIRVTESILMTQGFRDDVDSEGISIEIAEEGGSSVSYLLKNDFQPYSKWQAQAKYKSEVVGSGEVDSIDEGERELKDKYFEMTGVRLDNDWSGIDRVAFEKLLKNSMRGKNNNIRNYLMAIMKGGEVAHNVDNLVSRFIIYSPDNAALRDFSRHSQISPLGIGGEGLFKLIQVEHGSSSKFSSNLNNFLKHLGWFQKMDVPEDISSQSGVKIIDKFINKKNFDIDLRSANEGFLFLIFYFTLFSSDLTPRFFAVDNIDSSFNPKLCTALTREVVSLAKEYNKQALLTTHNPAILDGLNLDDDEQRLFVVSRNDAGHTKVERVFKRESKMANRPPQKLSELFMSGALGGLPRCF